jgi:hypothetical protein
VSRNFRSLVVFDDDKQRRQPDTLMTLTAGHIQSLAGRLEQRAASTARTQSLSASVHQGTEIESTGDVLPVDPRKSLRPACNSVD